MSTDTPKTEGPSLIRVYFEEKGQDFDWWDIEKMGPTMGKVIDCGPFQASVWVGYFVFSSFRPRCQMRFSKDPDDPISVLKYKIKSVEVRYPKHTNEIDPPVVEVGEKYVLDLRGMGQEDFFQVKPKSEVKEGRWVNVLQSAVYANQTEKDNAISQWRDGAILLRLGWLNPETYEIEVP